MNTVVEQSSQFSHEAKQYLFGARGEAWFLNNWERTVMIHFETDPSVLQQWVPFDLDLRDSKAYVSIVAFTMTRLRPRFGGRCTETLMGPIGSHDFLNVRTYVRCGGERGIYFLAEWLPNRVSVWLGPRVYGLPYRLGRTRYRHDAVHGTFAGNVAAADNAGAFSYHATPVAGCEPVMAQAGSLDEFLLERYTAFTRRGRNRFLFRVWHEPWLWIPLEVKLSDTRLLAFTGHWFSNAKLVGAHFCGDVREVRMGRPRRVADAHRTTARLAFAVVRALAFRLGGSLGRDSSKSWAREGVPMQRRSSPAASGLQVAGDGHRSIIPPKEMTGTLARMVTCKTEAREAN